MKERRQKPPLEAPQSRVLRARILRSDMTRPMSLIACGVFRSALEYLNLEKRHPTLRVTFLPSNLHLQPQELRNTLSGEIGGAQERNERTLCLYGNCFPDFDDFCNHHGVDKVPGHHCFQLLLGSKRYEDIMKEMVGTYFLERDLILHFEKYCLEPLALREDEIRRALFKPYRRVIYIRQIADPDLVPQAEELARFLGLPLEIRDADYSYLKQALVSLIEVFSQKGFG
jgi:hypothetical protein